MWRPPLGRRDRDREGRPLDGKRPRTPTFAEGTRLVAFIDDTEWFASGTLLAGKTLEQGVIRLTGFNDTGSHVVIPDLVTLDLLERRIKRGIPLKWTFRGPVMMPTPKGLAPSSLELTATLHRPDHGVYKARVTGIANLVDLGDVSVQFGFGERDDIRLQWHDTRRPLRFVGHVTGKNKDGTIAVAFRLAEPVMPEADLLTYMAKSRLRAPYHKLVLELGATKLPMVLGREPGLGTLSTQTIRHVKMWPNRDIGVHDGVTSAAITLKGSYKAASTDPVNALVEEAILGPIACTFHDAAGARSCSLRYVATRFAQP